MKGKTRQIATLSLLVMALGFTATLVVTKLLWPGNVWLLTLMAGFEAGLVGGFADWFAVTALFRHPMGIPIPHTAILPANRPRITQALVSMVENELLNKDSIVKKVQAVDATRLILGAAQKGLHTDAVKAMLQQIMRSVLASLPESQITAALRDVILKYAREADLPALLHTVAQEGLDRHYDEAALAFVLDKAEGVLSTEKLRDELGTAAVRAVLDMPMKGLMKATVPTVVAMMGEKKVGEMIQGFLISAARDMQHPENANRKSILASMHGAIEALPQNEALLQKLGEYRDELLQRDALEEQLYQTVVRFKVETLQEIMSPDFMEQKVIPFLDAILARTAADEETVQKLEGFLDAQLSHVIEANHENIGRLVRENIDRFETTTLIHMIESKVGNDLQWIRVNGAICGFAVGLALHGIKLLVG